MIQQKAFNELFELLSSTSFPENSSEIFQVTEQAINSPHSYIKRC